MDEAVEIEGYDGGIDDSPAYSPSPGRKSIPSPGHRGGKKALSQPSGGHRRHRSIGRPFGLNINPRALANAARSMLILSAVGVIAVAGILYYTFTTYQNDAVMQFYGALAAAVVVVLLLSYVTVKLIGGAD